MKYVHIASVIAGLLLPLISPITSMVEFAVDLSSNEVLQSQNISFVSGGIGYGLIRFPSILCSATDRYALYYSNLLPINIMVIVGITDIDSSVQDYSQSKPACLQHYIPVLELIADGCTCTVLDRFKLSWAFFTNVNF